MLFSVNFCYADDITKTEDITSNIKQTEQSETSNTEMQVNDKVVTLDVAPKLLNDRTFIPIRAVRESLNANVDRNESNQRVIITTVK